MTLLKDHLKLRLAARTLIEWKTPITAAEYQRAITDLLEIHPNAASWGLVPNKEIFKLDNEGVVLWYLSETIDLKKDISYKTYYQYKTFLQECCIDGLLDFGTSEEKTDGIISGFSKPQIADAIYKSIVSDNTEENFLGYFSLLSLIVPLSHCIQVENLKKLFLIKESGSKVIQSIRRTISYITIAFSTTKLAAIILSISTATLVFFTVLTWMTAIDAKEELETQKRETVSLYITLKEKNIIKEKSIKITEIIQELDKKTEDLHKNKPLSELLINFYKDKTVKQEEAERLGEISQDYGKLSQEYEILLKEYGKTSQNRENLKILEEANNNIIQAKYSLEGLEKKYKGVLGFLTYNIKGTFFIFVLSATSSALLIFINENSFREFIKRVVKNRSAKAERMIGEIVQKDPGAYLMEIIGNICSSNSGVLVSMLQTKSSILWGEIALSSTNKVIREVVCESLALIRNPEIEEATREKIFQWLCMVNVI